MLLHKLDSVDIEDVECFRMMSCCPSNLANSFVNFTYVSSCKVPATKSDINYINKVVKTELSSDLLQRRNSYAIMQIMFC